MNFSQFVEGSAIEAEAIAYYVNEKLIRPLFPEGHEAENGEYAEEDLYRLRVISNLRRLRFSIEDIRKIIYDPSKTAGVMVKHFDALNRKTKASVACIYALEDIDLANFQSPDEILSFFAELELDLPLPERDLNRDADYKNRTLLEEKIAENEEMHKQILLLESANRRHVLWMLLFIFLFVLSLGFILAPYIIW